MRISFALKTILAPLLAFLLLAGCATPVKAPLTVVPDSQRGVTITWAMPASDYQAQHLVEDIESLVFGLVDVSTSSAQLYFGYEEDGIITDAAHSNYHPIIAGNGNSGSDLFGDQLSLTDGERKQVKRYLYAVTRDRGKRAVTFSNVRPNQNTQYVAFVAAFKVDVTQGGALARADAIGFAASAPFKVDSAGKVEVQPLQMELNRALGSLKLELRINEDPAQPMADMSTLVVGLLDATAATGWNPAMGFEISADGIHPVTAPADMDTYHSTLLGKWTPGFVGGKFRYEGTPLANSSARADTKRALYYFHAGDLTTLPRPLNLTFSRLKPSAQYYPFAAIFKGGVGPTHLVYFSQATESVEVWPDENPPPSASSLTLTLSN